MLNLDKKKKYLLACSYGPDSMALFHMLKKDGYDFVVAHVNYHLREESDIEEAKLQKYCGNENVPLFVLDNKESITKNVEAKCREIRYRFFNQIYHQERCDALLVAHHEDDHIETYLLQKKRKNLVKHFGLAESSHLFGMLVIRPLLSFNKKELLAYCDDNHIGYSIDKTNLLPIYERNKIRIGTVEKMSEEDRGSILKEIDAQNILLNEIFNSIQSQNNDIASLLKLSTIQFAYYLNGKIQEINPEFKATYKQSLEIRDIMLSHKPNVTVFCEKNRVVIEKAYDKLIIKTSFNSDGYEFIVNKQEIIDNEFFFADLTSDTSNRNIHSSDYPITIRTYQKNDKNKIKDYEVSVRRLFIDWKMPLSLRKRWPIVVNSKGQIIYIPRYRKDFVVTEDTNFYVKECFTFK